jgi:biopolymer transport protein ExbD
MALQIPSPRSRKHARIEIIPLIDIIFFLLATFVMVSLSMIQNKGINVNLPAAASAAPLEQKEFTTITVTQGGEIYFDKVPTPMDSIDGALKALLASNPEPRVFINGDAKAEFGKAVQVLDIVRKRGITKVAIQTKPQDGPAAAPAPLPAPAAPAPTGP